jgi:hypothetical protein
MRIHDHGQEDAIPFDLDGFHALAEGIRKHTRSGGAVLDFAQAREARDAGINQAIDHAERIDDEWPDLAYSFLCRYARTHQFFQGWEVTRDATLMGYGAPTDDRAWGALFLKAIRNQVIEISGVGRNPNRHASICPAYRSLVFVGGAA